MNANLPTYKSAAKICQQTYSIESSKLENAASKNEFNEYKKKLIFGMHPPRPVIVLIVNDGRWKRSGFTMT